MKRYNKISNIKAVNTSESYFSEGLFLGDKWVIPYSNIHISNDSNLIEGEPIYKKINGNYIDRAYIVIEGIHKTTQNHEEYLNCKSGEKICIGGEHYKRNLIFFETFILCDKAQLLLPIDYNYSKTFYEKDSNLNSFFNNLDELYEVVESLF